MDTIQTAKVTLFEDIFEVSALNPDGYKLDKLNRIQATGTTFECDLLLDVNSELFTIKDTERLTLVLSSTLHIDGSPADHFNYIPSSVSSFSSNTNNNAGNNTNTNTTNTSIGYDEPTLADNYEYVMHGRVFDMTYKKDGTVSISFSYGGLLMRLTGDQRHLSNILPDQRLYLLLKKD